MSPIAREFGGTVEYIGSRLRSSDRNVSNALSNELSLCLVLAWKHVSLGKNFGMAAGTPDKRIRHLFLGSDKVACDHVTSDHLSSHCIGNAPLKQIQ